MPIIYDSYIFVKASYKIVEDMEHSSCSPVLVSKYNHLGVKEIKHFAALPVLFASVAKASRPFLGADWGFREVTDFSIGPGRPVALYQ